MGKTNRLAIYSISCKDVIYRFITTQTFLCSDMHFLDKQFILPIDSVINFRLKSRKKASV